MHQIAQKLGCFLFYKGRVEFWGVGVVLNLFCCFFGVSFFVGFCLMFQTSLMMCHSLSKTSKLAKRTLFEPPKVFFSPRARYFLRGAATKEKMLQIKVDTAMPAQAKRIVVVSGNEHGEGVQGVVEPVRFGTFPPFGEVEKWSNKTRVCFWVFNFPSIFHFSGFFGGYLVTGGFDRAGRWAGWLDVLGWVTFVKDESPRLKLKIFGS